MLFRRLLLALIAIGTNAWATEGPYDELIQQGHYKQARGLLEKALGANPRDAHVLMQLAFVKLEFNEVEAATKLAEQAIREQPNDAQTHAILADCYGQKADAAGILKGLSLARAFRKEADAALALDPMNYEALHSYMLFYLEAPGIAGGSKTKAEEMADRIARVNPAKGMLARAEIALHENHLDQLVVLYQKAAQADPGSYEAAIGLAGYYINFQKWRDVSKAEEYAYRAIKLDPARGRAYAIVAFGKAWNEQWTDLDQILATAEKAAPDNFVYYFFAGQALLITGKDNARAERYFRKYLKQPPEAEAPTHAQTHWRLGLVMEKEQKTTEAVQELETAVRMDPELKGASNDLKRLK
jgi:tetratricopeptide (TPR) repeat protein